MKINSPSPRSQYNVFLQNQNMNTTMSGQPINPKTGIPMPVTIATFEKDTLLVWLDCNKRTRAHYSSGGSLEWPGYLVSLHHLPCLRSHSSFSKTQHRRLYSRCCMGCFTCKFNHLANQKSRVILRNRSFQWAYAFPSREFYRTLEYLSARYIGQLYCPNCWVVVCQVFIVIFLSRLG